MKTGTIQIFNKGPLCEARKPKAHKNKRKNREEGRKRGQKEKGQRMEG